MVKIILASKSKVRKEILDKHNIDSEVEPSNVDEEIVKKSLIKEKVSPELISKNINGQQSMLPENQLRKRRRQL